MAEHHCEECGDRIEKGITRNIVIGDAHLCSTDCAKQHRAFLREQEDELGYDSDIPHGRRPTYSF